MSVTEHARAHEGHGKRSKLKRRGSSSAAMSQVAEQQQQNFAAAARANSGDGDAGCSSSAAVGMLRRKSKRLSGRQSIAPYVRRSSLSSSTGLTTLLSDSHIERPIDWDEAQDEAPEPPRQSRKKHSVAAPATAAMEEQSLVEQSLVEQSLVEQSLVLHRHRLEDDDGDGDGGEANVGDGAPAQAPAVAGAPLLPPPPKFPPPPADRRKQRAAAPAGSQAYQFPQPPRAQPLLGPSLQAHVRTVQPPRPAPRASPKASPGFWGKRGKK